MPTLVSTIRAGYYPKISPSVRTLMRATDDRPSGLATSRVAVCGERTAMTPGCRLPAMRWSALLVVAACSGGSATTGDPPLPGVARPDAVLAARLAAASAARGDVGHSFTNRLAFETSPYLLQHAHNPVSWYAWGDEAFDRARREGKLVLVSVGYSTCHWCHVMERESFENEEVASYVNANFICIKVDREERPDVDAVYMSALLAMKNSGGWPMNVITDAERRPVFGATYMTRPQLLGLMHQLRELQTTDPDRLEATAKDLVASLQRPEMHGAGLSAPEAIERGARNLARAFDPQSGGFGQSTKFPSPPDLELLLRYFRRTNDADALAMVTFTLERIAAGGIHDHLAGGFHRYATDRNWLVPHFEKMLYDNAQLASVFLEAHQITGEEGFGDAARTTLAYLRDEMTSPEGGFYSATDADSRTPEGTISEGYYFTWTPAEVDAVLGAEAGGHARAWYAVGGSAAVDGRSVLHTPRTLADLAATLGIADPRQLASELDNSRMMLRRERTKRTAPARDDKILTGWNGLAISAFARAGFAYDSAEDLRIAAKAADFVLTHLHAQDGGLLRSYRDGQARQAGTLEDYAYLAAGLLDLFESTWERKWLEAAISFAHELDRRFADPAGGYFATDDGGERLLVRTKPTDDGVLPSANAVAIHVMLRLDTLTEDARWRAKADLALSAFGGILAAETRTPALRGALDRALDTALEIVIVAPSNLAAAQPLLAEVRKRYLPNATVIAVTEAQLTALVAQVPMLDGKKALGGEPTAFVCERSACKQPTKVAAELGAQLDVTKPLLPDRTPGPLR